MGTIKDRNGMDLTEAEDIKKRWQEYTEELYKKDLNNPDNHNSVTTHLELDILEYEAKWALGSITTNKASGGDGQEATVKTEHGTTDWFQIGKGVYQGCILSPCLFNLYAELTKQVFCLFILFMFI